MGCGRRGKQVTEGGLHQPGLGATARERLALVGQCDQPRSSCLRRQLTPGLWVDDLIDAITPSVKLPQDRRIPFAGIAPGLQLVAGRATHFGQRPSSAASVGSPSIVLSGRSLDIEPSGLPIHGEDTLVEMTPPVFGASVRRVEDPRLIRGAGRYVDDIQPSGCLHAVFLRSHLAHATITRLDLDAAAQAPGVIAVWSAADLEDLKPLEIEAPVDGTPLPERRG